MRTLLMKLVQVSSILFALAALWIALSRCGPRGVLEAEGFRVVRDRQTIWEVVPIDGGTQMTFFRDGQEACCILTQWDVITWHMQSGTTTSDVIVDRTMFAESLACENGKDHAVISRRIVRADSGLRASNDVVLDSTSLSMTVDGSAVTAFARSGRNTTRLDLGEKQASVVSSVPDDLHFDIHIGGIPFEATCQGSIVGGFGVALRRPGREWSWSSK
jgi:hypothetical protein